MTVPRRFRHTGLVLLRATTCPEDVAPPRGLDLADAAAVGGQGRAWLARVWARREVREAVEMASPVLAARIDHLVATGHASDRRLRRAVTSVASYLLRWERRATPFGTFAGVTTADLGPATAKIGTSHRLVIRADAEWLTSLIKQVEQNRAVRMRLTVATDNTGLVRDGFFIAPRRAELGARSPGPLLEASVRLTTPVAYVLDQAAAPVRLDVLAERMSQRFPSAAADRIHQLLHGLIDGGFLITSLRPASTVEDPLNHLIQALRAAGVQEPGAQQLGEVAGLLGQLETISAQIAQHNITTDASQAARRRTAVANTMRGLASGTGSVLATDVRLDAHFTLPRPVVEEAERAADVLLRLSTQPFGTAAWMDYHARFLFRTKKTILTEAGSRRHSVVCGQSAGGRSADLRQRRCGCRGRGRSVGVAPACAWCHWPATMTRPCSCWQGSSSAGVRVNSTTTPPAQPAVECLRRPCPRPVPGEGMRLGCSSRVDDDRDDDGP